MEQPCPQCGQYVADTEEFCPNPSCGTYLGWDRQGSQPPSPVEHPAPGASGAAVASTEQESGQPPTRTSHVASLSAHRLDIVPGESGELTVTVTNTGTVVDEVRITVDSPLAPYVSITPPAVQVYPGAQATARVTVSLPREEGPWAGAHALVLQFASTRADDPGQHGSQIGATVVVDARVGMSARLVPTQSAGRSARFRSAVEMANHGNTPMRVSLGPRDDQGAIQWRRLPSPVLVDPGDFASIPLIARCRRNWWGDPDQHRFDVAVHGTPEVGEDEWEQRLEGRRDLQAVLSGWRIWALAAAVVAALVLLLAPVGLALLDDGDDDAQIEVDDSGQVTLPDFTGREADQVTSELEGEGFQVQRVEETSGVDAGLVLTQDPPPDTVVQRGDSVTLVVSLGPAPDDVVCAEVAEARQVLADQGPGEESAQAAVDVVDSASADGVDGGLVALADAVRTALEDQDQAALGAALDQMAAACGQ